MKKPMHDFNVFIDADGVLADFDKRAIELCDGVRPRDFEGQAGEQALWDRVYSVDNFFLDLEPMKDAYELWNGVLEMGFDPTILTGFSTEAKNQTMSVPLQKDGWGKKTFGPATKVITCPSRDKCLHMIKPGDVLIDDWAKYMYRWQEAGGVFILHKSSDESLRALKAYMEQRALM